MRWTEREASLLKRFYPEHGPSWGGWEVLLEQKKYSSIVYKAHCLKVLGNKSTPYADRKPKPREEAKMKIVKPKATLVGMGPDEFNKVVMAARTCYKSESRGRVADELLVRRLIDNGHEAMIEHGVATMLFVCDRGVSHELVRHRIASYAQESTRYCNYAKDKFGNEVTFIDPSDAFGWEQDGIKFEIWKSACMNAEKAYMQMLESGCTPEEARDVLPTSVKTEVVMTANFREWRHFIKLRTAKEAHPQMRQVALLARRVLKSTVPVIFDDLG